PGGDAPALGRSAARSAAPARRRGRPARRRAARGGTPACASRPPGRPTVRLVARRSTGSRGGKRMSDIVAITSIAAGGDGVGRLGDGRAVFVPRTAPGERVRLRDGVKLHKSFARAELAEVVAPSGARVTPACPPYLQDRCGGCPLPHVAYDS